MPCLNFRVLAATTFVSVLLTAPGQSADLAKHHAAPAAALTPTAGASLWSGLYLGAHAGYGFGSAGGAWTGTTATVLGDAIPDVDLDGALGGIQIGYLWQRDSWVYGLEADASLTGLDGGGVLKVFTPGPSVTITGSPEPKWLTTVRGRIGYAVDRWQVYGAGGVAVMRADYTIGLSNGAMTQASSAHGTHVGWTLGAGVEYALTDSIRIGLDYRYLDFAEKNYVFSGDAGTSLTSKLGFDLHQATLRLNYRF